MQQLTLSQLNQLIKSTLDQQLAPSYWVVAEIGEMRINQKGHCYLEFVEKEDQRLTAKLRANLWAYDFRNLNSLFLSVTGQSLKPGMKILARVMVQFHEVYGLSLQVKDLDPNFTLGERARQRQKVIDRLNREGIMNNNTRLRLPLVPQRVAVVSSRTTAGYGDFMDQLVNNQQRYHFQVDLFETVMQGEEAAESIARAIGEAAKKKEKFDILVIIRGGGSQIDLDCFDSYLLASTIAEFPLPVITGIGHQRDDTVADMVANTKIKTPTAVAEFLINGMKVFEEQLNFQFKQIKDCTSRHLQDQRTQLFGMLKNMGHGAKTLINTKKYALGMLKQRLISAADSCIKDNRSQLLHYQEALRKQPTKLVLQEKRLLQILETKITMADPENILKRGYTITYLNDKVIKADTEIKEGDELNTKLPAKSIISKVLKVSNE